MALGMIGVGFAVSEKMIFQYLLDIWLKLNPCSTKIKDCPQLSCIDVQDSSEALIPCEPQRPVELRRNIPIKSMKGKTNL